MNISITEHKPIIIIKVDSSILQEHIPEFKACLAEMISQKKSWFIFDLQDADYISSLGISIIIHLKNSAIDNGGDLVLVNVNRLIENLLNLTNLLEKLEIFTNTEIAIKALNNRMMV